MKKAIIILVLAMVFVVSPIVIAKEKAVKDDLSLVPNILTCYIAVFAQFCDEDGYQGLWEKVFKSKQDVSVFLRDKFEYDSLYSDPTEIKNKPRVWCIREPNLYTPFRNENNIRRYLIGVYKIGEKLPLKDRVTEVKRYVKDWEIGK